MSNPCTGFPELLHMVEPDMDICNFILQILNNKVISACHRDFIKPHTKCSLSQINDRELRRVSSQCIMLHFFVSLMLMLIT